MRKLPIVILLLALSAAAVAQNQYYVSTSGSDSNPGTQAQPWRHISKAIASFSLGVAGAQINVHAGTYSDENISCAGFHSAVCFSRGGSSPTVRLKLVCDAQWSVPSGSGCIIRDSSGDAIFAVNANDIDIGAVNQFGFDGSNTGRTSGVRTQCNLGDGQTGNCTTGNGVHVLGNYFHDLATAVGACTVNPNGNPAIQIGIHHGPYVTDTQVIGNRITNIGPQSISKLNGGAGCQTNYGMYIETMQAVIQNNIIVNTAGWGIQYYSSPCQGIISGNSISRTEMASIIVGGGDCNNGVPAGSITVSNNIFGTTGPGFPNVDIGVPGGGGTGSAAHPVLVTNNIFSGGATGQTQCIATCFTTFSNSISEAPTVTFVSYAGGNNDDFHLKNGSAAIHSGTNTCVSGGQTPCVNPLDFSGIVRPSPPSRGVYELAGAGGSVTLTSSLSFGNQLVGSPSASQNAVLTNTTASSITIVSTALGGTAPGDYLFTAPGATLASGASVNIPVIFKPIALGSRPATLTVTYGAGTQLVTALSGTGIGSPALCFSPASITFLSQQIGIPSAASPFTVTNCGNANLTVSALSVTTNLTEFSETDNCGTRPFTLAVGISCTVNPVFTPSGVGTRNGTIRATDNASGSPHSEPLSGTGFNAIVPPETIMIKGSVVITGGVVVGGPPN